MPDDLYQRDALAWAEQQADLLRRLADGERLNAPVDWPNVIEEVRDVGLSELRACRSLLRQALLHLLKLHAWPQSPAAPHWREETGRFLADASDRFSPSMRQRIDIAEFYAAALHLFRDVAANTQASAVAAPNECPFSLDELIAPEPDLSALLALLGHE